uniref:Uncharacterized protein n=1 Tax=Kuenenia stuttgartiensis TaxID=174633 RepID=Q1PYY6_KUEST|nr:unknown protein [Candidatus Kuenenia stuttgartiensis]
MLHISAFGIQYLRLCFFDEDPFSQSMRKVYENCDIREGRGGKNDFRCGIGEGV